MIHVAAELKRAGVHFLELDWATGKLGTFVHRAVMPSRDAAEDLVRWAAANAVTMGEVSYPPRRVAGSVSAVETEGES